MTPRRRQLHAWITEADYKFLKAQAAQQDTTVGAVVRALIRGARQLGTYPDAIELARAAPQPLIASRRTQLP